MLSQALMEQQDECVDDMLVGLDSLKVRGGDWRIISVFKSGLDNMSTLTMW